METAKQLARLLPEMARLARTSQVTAESLHTLLGGMKRSYWTREISELLGVALKCLEEANSAEAGAQSAAWQRLEAACRELGAALVGADDQTGPSKS